MPANDHDHGFAIAQRLRLDAERNSKRRLLNLARMNDINVKLVRGSRHAIAESRELIAKTDKLLSR